MLARSGEPPWHCLPNGDTLGSWENMTRGQMGLFGCLQDLQKAYMDTAGR
jgi:hypothetical protein